MSQAKKLPSPVRVSRAWSVLDQLDDAQFLLQFQARTRRRARARLEDIDTAIDRFYPTDALCVSRGLNGREMYLQVLSDLVANDPLALAIPVVGSYRWADLADRLSRSGIKRIHLQALRGALLVEDHAPLYGDAYSKMFPIANLRNTSVYRINREFRRISPQWIYQETLHADLLKIWFVCSGQIDVLQLEADMAVEAVKPYIPPHPTPIGLLAYTGGIQEPATSLYYRMLREVLEELNEPIVCALLTRLDREETGHCRTFLNLLRPVVERGRRKDLEIIREALTNPAMPLSDSLTNYEGIAARMAVAAGRYDYRQAFATFRTFVKKIADASTRRKGHPLAELVAFADSLCPA